MLANQTTKRSWEELAALAATETNPKKLAALVDELCYALDDRQRHIMNFANPKN